ncbi:MAG: hydrogenase maturation protease [Chloroflexota bacterium]
MTDGTAPRVAIIGIGNPVMSDDGIGPRLVSELEGTVPGVDLIDMGTGGMQLVHVLAQYDAVIIIDSADIGLSPGEARLFSPGEVVSLKEVRAYSLHDWDIMRSIEISRELGEAPERSLIFAVQPAFTQMGEILSPEVEQGIPAYIEQLRKSLTSLRP